jgi:hypothetical protein
MPAAETFAPPPTVPLHITLQLPDVVAALGTAKQTPDFLMPSSLGVPAAELYGSNSMVVRVPPVAGLLAKNLLHPFCLFQYASIVIWCYTNYWSYSAIIFFITMATVVGNTWLQYRNKKRLADLAYRR